MRPGPGQVFWFRELPSTNKENALYNTPHWQPQAADPGFLQLPFQVRRSHWTLRQRSVLPRASVGTVSCSLVPTSPMKSESSTHAMANCTSSQVPVVCSEQGLGGDRGPSVGADKSGPNPALLASEFALRNPAAVVIHPLLSRIGPSERGLGCGKGPAVPPALRRSSSCRNRRWPWPWAAAAPST